jgi:Tannase and feruloyl esterase
VEQGAAPEAVVATRADRGDGRAPASRPLCPYPAHAQYVGGDVDAASSFACRGPAS